MRARLGLAVGSALVALAGCGSTPGSTEGFVSSNRTITVVPMSERVPAPELAGLDLHGNWLRAHQRALALFGGGLMIALGILLVTGLWDALIIELRTRIGSGEVAL